MLLYVLTVFYHGQSFVHDKSSSIAQFISFKSKNLQKLLRYLSGIVTSTFKAGTGGRGVRGGRGSWDPPVVSGGCGAHFGCAGLCGVFPTIFVLYLNDLPSEALSSTSSVLSL